MTLDNSEDFALAQEYLIDEGLLDAPVDPDNFNEDPFDYLAGNRQGTFHRSFRPQIITELDEAMGDEWLKYVDMEDNFEPKKYTAALNAVEQLGGGIERFKKHSNAWIVNDRPDFETLYDLSKVSLANNLITVRDDPSKSIEEFYIFPNNMDEVRIYESVHPEITSQNDDDFSL